MRRRRVPPPLVRADSEEEAAADLLQVKVEPGTWVEQLPAGPPQHPTDRPTMLQLGEGSNKPLVVLYPEAARSMGALAPQSLATLPPSVAGPPTADDTAADRGAGGTASDSDDDPPMIDPDQFLETELASGKSEAVVDEDLTSLSWLQDKDLLKGIQLRPAAVPATPPVKPKPEPEEESPTSDYLEEAAEGARSADESPPAAGRVVAERFNARHLTSKHPDHQAYAYDPKIHVHFKPPFSFSCLIFMAIEDSRHKALPVKEIYGWIQEHFPFYRTAPVGWKNSVRHNLSLNKCFKRVDKFPVAKGSFWTVEAMYRMNLMETLKRSPCVYPWKYDDDAHGKPWAAAAAQLGRTGLYRRLRVARTKDSQTYGRRGADGDDSGDGGPNPELFPFLAARLMSGPGGPQSSSDPRQGGPDKPSRLLTPQLETAYKRMREGQFHDMKTGKARKVENNEFVNRSAVGAAAAA